MIVWVLVVIGLNANVDFIGRSRYYMAKEAYVYGSAYKCHVEKDRVVNRLSGKYIRLYTECVPRKVKK